MALQAAPDHQVQAVILVQAVHQVIPVLVDLADHLEQVVIQVQVVHQGLLVLLDKMVLLVELLLIILLVLLPHPQTLAQEILG
jgi:hypothetical protein